MTHATNLTPTQARLHAEHRERERRKLHAALAARNIVLPESGAVQPSAPSAPKPKPTQTDARSPWEGEKISEAVRSGKTWRIRNAVLRKHRLPFSELLAGSRHKEVSACRAEIAWTLWQHTNLSSKQIAVHCGNVDHSSVLTARDRHARNNGLATRPASEREVRL